MKFGFNVLAKSVPAIIIVCGFVAVFVFQSNLGWILIILGVGLQVLYLLTKNR